MSNLTIANVPRISAPVLATLLRSNPGSVAVIDVRDADYIGGHIANSRHVPSSTLDYAVPELVRTLADNKTVVFHCMLSQQRGPSAALRYARERERLLGSDKGLCLAEGEDGEAQRVCVLQGGFGAWKEKYAEDATLTEGYNKALWDDDFDD